LADLFGDGGDGTRDHQLPPGELLTAVTRPPPVNGEWAAYFRATSRTAAEWSLAEAVARIVVADGLVTVAAIAVGGVAPVPLRLPRVEAALSDRPAVAATIAAACKLVDEGANPLPMTAYKAALLLGAITEALERATS
jgi:xanthine dehydrogenase YagS FAD-binding subunit